LVSAGTVTYRQSNDTLTASVPVATRGSGATTATLRIVDANQSRPLVSRTVLVPGATPGTASAYASVEVTLPTTVSVGDRLVVTGPS
jgi:hypothetical protein